MKILLVLSTLLFIVSCSTTSKEKLFNKGIPTMKEVYEKKFDHLSVKDNIKLERKIVDAIENTDKSVLSTIEKLQQQFPKAPNPTMIMHVFRHFTHSGTPVPEYNTYFTMYENDHFTLSDDH